MTPDEAKRALRARAAEQRAHAARTTPTAAEQLWTHLPTEFGSVRVVAGYVRFRTEIDPAPLLRHFAERGAVIALPCVGDGPLIFREWTVDGPLVRSRFGVLEPDATAPAVTPDLVFAPLLAFDRRGFRLGYGQGHYDRTLARLRAEGLVVAVGLAFAAQEVELVPTDAFDQPLDWIVTERGAIRSERA